MDETATSLTLFLHQVGFSKYVHKEELQELVLALEIVTLSPGNVLLTEGEKGDALYLLWRGRLQVYKEIAPEQSQIIAEVDSRKWVGELQLLLGGEQLASVQAVEESQLIRFPKTEIVQLNAKYPDLNQYFVRIAQKNLKELKFTSLLYDFFGVIERSCIIELQQNAEWLQLHRGDCLFSQGELGDSLYFVLNGRFNAVIEDSRGTIPLIVPITNGEIIGEMSILTNEPRSASIYALRDSVLIRYSSQQFKQIIEKYPPLLLKLTEHLIDRFKKQQSEIIREKMPLTGQGFQLHRLYKSSLMAEKKSDRPYQRIAILAHDPETPLREFSKQLADALSIHGSVLHLNREYLVESLEFPESIEFSHHSSQGLRFQLWLEEQEKKYHFILLEADIGDSPWTQFCIGQVDRIVWLARGAAEPSLSPIEQQVQARQSSVTRFKQTLVLIHPSSLKLPSRTCNWLGSRTLDIHHHIRWHYQRDIERVARFLANKAIGVALGGGGGRGAAHIGVLQALEEANIPVDFVGGTSIGGLIAAQYAMGWDIPTMVQRNKEMLVKNNPFKTYTIPMLSLIDGKKLDKTLQSFYTDVQIEDLWLNCFCISTNISIGEKVAHRIGSLWKAVRATIALPGIFVPLIEEGDLLIDGGGLDNDPSLTMGELKPGPIILSSVAPRFVPKVAFTYEDLPSPLKIFWHWVNPWSKPIELPNLVDILAMSMGVNSIKNYEQSFAAADLALIPPLDQYGIFDFKATDEIIRVSYEYALERLKTWSHHMNY